MIKQKGKSFGSIAQSIKNSKWIDYAQLKIVDSVNNIPRLLQNLSAITDFAASIFPLQDSPFYVPPLPGYFAFSRFLSLPMPTHRGMAVLDSSLCAKEQKCRAKDEVRYREIQKIYLGHFQLS